MNGIITGKIEKPAGTLEFKATISYSGQALINQGQSIFVNEPYIKITDLYGQIILLKGITIRSTNYYTLQNASGNYSPSFSIEYWNDGITCSFNNTPLSDYILLIEGGTLS